MYDIESILMALFGGGYGDWNDIANTEYDWENIFELLKEKYGSLDNVDINNIYTTIMEMGQIDFMAMIDEYIKENKDSKNKEVKRIVDNAYNRARTILSEHVDKLHAVAGILLEKEKIEGEEFDKIFEE